LFTATNRISNLFVHKLQQERGRKKAKTGGRKGFEKNAFSGGGGQQIAKAKKRRKILSVVKKEMRDIGEETKLGGKNPQKKKKATMKTCH